MISFLADTIDTPKEGIGQHKKREYVKGTITKGKLRGNKKKNNTTKPLIKYAEYKEHELNK